MFTARVALALLAALTGAVAARAGLAGRARAPTPPAAR
jgi:hypothetical protein